MWKLQLTTENNFIHSIDHDDERVMNSKSGNIEIMINDEADEVIKERFDSLKNRSRKKILNQKKVVSFSSIMFFYKYHKINWNCGGSYIDSADWT